MNADDKVEDHLERGSTADGDAVPNGAGHVRRVLESSSVWGDPPPGVLDSVLGRIRAERAAESADAEASETPPAPWQSPDHPA